jgi:hypothetical protein
MCASVQITNVYACKTVGSYTSMLGFCVYIYIYMCVRVRACMYVCVCVCVRVCLRLA